MIYNAALTWPKFLILTKPSQHISWALCSSSPVVRSTSTVNTVLCVEIKNWWVMKLSTWPAKSQTLNKSLPDNCMVVISIPNVLLITSSSLVTSTDLPSKACMFTRFDWHTMHNYSPYLTQIRCTCRYGRLRDCLIAVLPTRGWPQIHSLIRSNVTLSRAMSWIHCSNIYNAQISHIVYKWSS